MEVTQKWILCGFDKEKVAHRHKLQELVLQICGEAGPASAKQNRIGAAYLPGCTNSGNKFAVRQDYRGAVRPSRLHKPVRRVCVQVMRVTRAFVCLRRG